MNSNLYPLWLTVAAALLWQPKIGLAGMDFNLSGFGTVGYAISDNASYEYTLGQRPNGADDTGSFEPDSRLGVQLDADVDDKTSVTVQLLSSQNYAGEFTPEVEWAFLKSPLNDSIVLRVGRIGVPFFMVSDYRYVGYANTTLRPVENSYYLASLGRFDGMDLTGYFDWGDTEITAQATFGYGDEAGSFDIDYSFRDGIGGFLSFERGSTRLRFGYIQTRISLRSETIGQIADGFNQAATVYPELANDATDFSTNRKKASFFGIGLELDLEPIALAAEFNQRNVADSFFPSYNAWYITAAYRWRDFTPYVTFSQLTQTSKTEVNLPDNPLLAPLDEILTSIYDAGNQSSAIVGMRWDFMENAAAKFQAENISREGQGASFIQKDGAESDIGTDVKVFSFSVDFTF